MRPELYSETFRALCREVGLRPIHLHLIRHTLAVELIRAGVSIVDAATLLGHNHRCLCEHLPKEVRNRVRSAASALEAALAGGL